MLNTTRLHQMLVDAGLLVVSVRAASDDAGPWSVAEWSAPPTQQQSDQAAAIIATFDPSPVAHKSWLDQQESALAAIRDQAAGAIADIDAYLLGADGATAAQVRAEVKAIDQRQKKVIQALLRIVKKVWG